MRFVTKCLLVLPLAASLWSSRLDAGVKISGIEQDLEDNVKYETVLYLTDYGMRGDRQGPDEDISFVFRADTNEAYFIDHKDRTYRVMTGTEAEQLKLKIDEAMQKMKEQIQMLEQQLKNMPAEQREMVKKMIERAKQQQQGDSGVRYRRVATSKKVAGFSCDVYEGYREGEKVEEVCAARPQALGLTQEDFQVIEKAQAYFARITNRLGAFFAIDLSGEWKEGQEGKQYPGIPLLNIQYEDGQPIQRSEVTAVEKVDLARELFEIPEGYRKVALMEVPSQAK